jgi:hypothetical protein
MMRRVPLLTFLMTMAPWAIAQVPADIQSFRQEPHGDRSALLKGVLDGNSVRCIFFNTSQLARWPDGMGMEWPKGTGHNYIETASPAVGVRFKLSDSTTVTTVEGSALQGGWDRFFTTRYRSGFEAVPGYTGSGRTARIATSVDSYTWPPSWNGTWRWLDGVDTGHADFETYSVTDDAHCPDLGAPKGNYQPIISDTTRFGLGLRIETRGLQWNRDSLARDILFFVYDVINLSDFDYDSAAIGLAVIPGVGSFQMSTPRQALSLSASEDMIVASAPGGIGWPDNWKTGLMGLAVLETPVKAASDTVTAGIGSFSMHTKMDTSVAGFRFGNDSTLWHAMTSGIGDTVRADSAVSYIVASKPFALPKWSRRRFVVAYVLAFDRARLSRVAARAHQIAAAGYRFKSTASGVAVDRLTGIPRSASLFQNYPNPFNPSTTIRYGLPGRSPVTLTVFNTLGQQVSVLQNGEQDTGYHEVSFDGAHLPGGVYLCRIQAGGYAETKKMLLIK